MAILSNCLSLFEHGWLYLLPVISVIALLVYRLTFAIRYPNNLPLLGEPAGRRWFSLRTRWRYYTDCGAMYREAYENYTSKERSVLLPNLGVRNDIVLPQSAMKWVMSRPESELSHVDAILEVVQLKYSLGSGKYKADQWPSMLVKTELNSLIEQIGQDINDELVYACERYLGHDSGSSTDLDVLVTCRKIISQVAGRFIVGVPLCRNEEYIKDMQDVMDRMVITGGLIGALPRILRPFIGPLMGWKVRQGIDKVMQHFRPIYHERLALLQTNTAGAKETMPEPRDLVQMMLRFAQQERPAELHDLATLTRRLCFANFAAIHQTSILLTNLLLNVVASNNEFDTVAVLREEMNNVLDGSNDWTKFKVAQMLKTDSVARETLRLNSYSNRGLFRKVMANGLETEDGVKLPKGAYISFLGHPLQCDAKTFNEPFRFKPFRFSEQREQNPALTNLSFVSTSAQHLPFGHGSHSCPGRFLVDFELKMILAYVLNHYNMSFPNEYNGRRPENRWVAEAFAPPSGARILFHRI